MTKYPETRQEQTRHYWKVCANHSLLRAANRPAHSPIVSSRAVMHFVTGGTSFRLPYLSLSRLNAMNLDVNTLFLVTIYVEAILGLLLLFVWVQNTAIYAVAWWGFADLLRAASVVLFGLYGSVSDLISIDLANALLFTAFALTWTGARVFDYRRPLPILLFGGAALWLVLCRIPSVASSWDIRVPSVPGS